MWIVIEYIIIAAIILISITEFFYPLLTQKPLFGSFRRKTTTQEKHRTDGPLDEKLSQAKEKVKEVKKVQDEVAENFKSAEELKNESDNLLK